MDDQVILVDENDHAVGVSGKIEAHRLGILHRAFSTFVLDADGRLLIQRRAVSKYHSGGLWANTCCGHPRPGEGILEAANRRLMEEMGIECDLEPMFSFIYRAQLDNSLIEHEIDHVLVGRSNQNPNLNPDEADAWQAVELDRLCRDVRENPDQFVFWLRVCIDKVVGHISTEGGNHQAVVACQ